MEFDKLSMFSDEAALTVSAKSSKIDLLKDGDSDISRKLNIVAQLQGSSITPTTATVQVSLEMCADGDDPDTVANWKTMASYETVLVSDALAGKRLVNFAKMPLGCLRYVRLGYTVLQPGTGEQAGTMVPGTLSGAKVLAGLTESCEIDN